MIQAVSTWRRINEIEALRPLSARAQVPFQLIIKVGGRSIIEEKEATAHHQSTGGDIVDTTEKRADLEVDRRGNTVARRNGRVRANRTATPRVELRENINHQDIVGSILTRSIVENEDLPVHHRIVNGRVRRTENVRPDHPVDPQGGL